MPDELDHFLEEIFEKCPLRISIKTRIGKENPAEWERLLAIYEKYPLEELIVHPRVQTDFYKNRVNLEAFDKAPLASGGTFRRQTGKAGAKRAVFPVSQCDPGGIPAADVRGQKYLI